MTADIRQGSTGRNVLFEARINAVGSCPNSVKRGRILRLVAEGVHIVTMSKDGTSAENIADLEEGILHAGGVTMVTSAGNEGREIRATEAAALDTWIAVGAANIINGQPKRARYSNTGANLDVMGFSELYTVAGVPFDGTSASAPFVAGMLALWFERFYEVNGRFPTHQESYQFCVTNTVDMEDKGFDEKTGYGLFVLPKPESVKGDKVMPAKRPLIYIDPGHGGVDNGAIDNGIIEKNLNLQVACQVRDLLRAHGVDVKMAREDDLGVASNEELWFRTSEANALNLGVCQFTITGLTCRTCMD